MAQTHCQVVKSTMNKFMHADSNSQVSVIEILSATGCGFTSQHGLVTRGYAPAGQRHAIVANRHLVLRKALLSQAVKQGSI